MNLLSSAWNSFPSPGYFIFVSAKRKKSENLLDGDENPRWPSPLTKHSPIIARNGNYARSNDTSCSCEAQRFARLEEYSACHRAAIFPDNE